MFEVELRGLMNEAKFKSLTQELESLPSANDDKLTVFFAYDSGIFKVVERKYDGEVKLSLKLGDETRNSLEEHEVRLKPGSLEDTVKVLEHIGYRIKSRVTQKRTNYTLEDSIELSLKHTEDWGYHFEIEKLVSSRSKVDDAKQQLQDVLGTLGLKPMTESELSAFLEQIEAKSRPRPTA